VFDQIVTADVIRSLYQHRGQRIPDEGDFLLLHDAMRKMAKAHLASDLSLTDKFEQMGPNRVGVWLRLLGVAGESVIPGRPRPPGKKGKPPRSCS